LAHDRTSGEVMRTQQWSFVFHTRQQTSWLSEWFLAIEDTFCFLELASEVYRQLSETGHTLSSYKFIS